MKVADAKRKSGAACVVFLFYDLFETTWGGSPAVTSLPEGIDSISQADQENVDCILKGPYEQPCNSSSSNNSFSSLSNVADGLDNEDQILQQNQNTNKRREGVTDLLNNRKDVKLATKTRPEKRKLNYAEKTSS